MALIIASRYGCPGGIEFDVHWVVGASAYGLQASKLASFAASASNGSGPEAAAAAAAASRSGAVEKFAALNGSAYDTILVVLGTATNT